MYCDEDENVFFEFTNKSYAKIEKKRYEEENKVPSEYSIVESIKKIDLVEPPRPPKKPTLIQKILPCLAKKKTTTPTRRKKKPNKEFLPGNTLPERLKNQFPSNLAGKPIEELDEFWKSKPVFCVVSKGLTIYRFSAKNALFILSPLNPIRRVAIFVLTHAIFSALVMLTILVNCIFMALPPEKTTNAVEYTFTGIYTLEALIKILARGFILDPFSFLRDGWNWLDFIVITQAYATMIIPNLGNMSILRTFRVLRALKTVAIVPGLKTIVDALIQSVIRLKDVIMLASFILSVFALIGLQLYMGVLRRRCVLDIELDLNLTDIDYYNYINNEENWAKDNYTDEPILCGNGSMSRHCPPGSSCLATAHNPDSNYTSMDWYAPAMLTSFRLMTQDYWDGLYVQVLATEGLIHMVYFIIVIFLGSFYLINLILAIVALSYNEQQMKAAEEAAAIEAEREKAARRRSRQLSKKNKTSITTDDNTIMSDPQSVSMALGTLETQKSIDMPDIRSGKEKKKSKKKPESKIVVFFKTKVLSVLCTICCKWDCFPPFKYVQKFFGFFVLDPFMDLFIMICIILNTLLLALDHHNMDPTMASFLDKGNYFFTAVFAIEAFSKLIALTPSKYLRDGWNCFDLFIVILSLVELMLSGVKGLSVLRTFRLLRVFKLAKSWSTLNRLITIIGKTIGALGNLTFILVIIVFIFAVVGMQLFGKSYADHADYFDGGIPRWSFVDFFHSFLMVFRVLCGEWIEPMWDCLNVGGGWVCVPFFISTLIIGNLVVLNLFLGLLLSSFGDLNEDPEPSGEGEEDADKIAIALGRISRFVGRIKSFLRRKVCCCICRKKAKDPYYGRVNSIATSESAAPVSFHSTNAKTYVIKDVQFDDNPGTITINDIDGAEAQVQEKVKAEEKAAETPEDIQPCCWPCYYKRFEKSKYLKWINNDETPFMKRWLAFRRGAFKLVEHKYFELFIIIMILLSSVVLAMEDRSIDEKPDLKHVMEICDHVFTIIFVLEMVLKWFGYGFHKYFTDAWCWLDFIIVTAALLNYSASFLGKSDISIFKTMRILRALRPLRALSRFEGIRVVVNALISSMPPIFNVMLVCLVFWLIFSIMGVQLFAGKFYKCVNSDLTDLEKEDQVKNRSECEERNLTWMNPRINFDNVPNAYLALLQVATFSGWDVIMSYAADIPSEIDEQPVPEQSLIMTLYFVVFVIVGAFFTLNLFIGVIIDNFNQQKEKLGGNSINIFLTETQKKYYQAMKKIGNKKPFKALPRPKFPVARLLFDITSNQKFEIFIMVMIVLNMIAMCCEHYGQSEETTVILGYFNYIFIAIFTMECVMKILALHWRYFTFPWNVFDFIVVLISLLALVFEDFIKRYINISPTVLRVVRVARVGRVLRLIKGARGVRTLLFALVISLPALLNIGSLLLLVVFIYAIFGMNFFMYITHGEKLNDHFNFDNIFKSIITLFPLCTSGGWNDLLEALSLDRDGIECDSTVPSKSQIAKGNCGNPAVAIAYLVSFIVFAFFIIVNMYIAVILENFNQAREEEKQGLTDDDYDMFYEVWQRFDPDCTEFIAFDRLPDFVDALEPPLRLPKPNKFKLISMNLTICEHNRIHCIDILDGLTKSYLAPNESLDDVLTIETIKLKKEQNNYKPISTTFMIQRQNVCAKIITRTIRRYIQMKKDKEAEEKLKEERKKKALEKGPSYHINIDKTSFGRYNY